MISKLIPMIKRHEGFRLKPYRCTAGKLTIGYGRNLDDVGINETEAEFLLLSDVREATDNAQDTFPEILKYSQNRQMALINMCFNLGKTRLKQFKRMIAAIEKGSWGAAADEAMDSRWYKQVGIRAVEIVDLLRGG